MGTHCVHGVSCCHSCCTGWSYAKPHTGLWGCVHVYEFPLDAGTFEVPQTEWKPQAMAPDLEARVIHSQRLFLGRTEQNRRETVSLMHLLLRA